MPAMQETYSSIVLSHFFSPKGIGFLDPHDGLSLYGDPDCGDFLEITIKLSKDNDRLEDMRYRIKGCPAAIASSSMTYQLAVGKTIEEVLIISDAEIDSALGGLPEAKKHCSLLAVRCLHMAIQDAIYRRLFIKAGIVKNDQEYLEKLSAGELDHFLHKCNGDCEIATSSEDEDPTTT